MISYIIWKNIGMINVINKMISDIDLILGVWIILVLLIFCS